MSSKTILAKAVDAQISQQREKKGAEAPTGGVSTHKRLPQGLCTSCMHAQTCMYLNKQELTVFHCEEFETAPGSGRQYREAALQSILTVRCSSWKR